jgi:class 3 adenylate cyclase
VILCGVLLAIVLIMRNQRKVQKLLLNILPESIAERLKRKEKPIADFCENVTVVFIDIVNFTSLSAQIHPHDMVNILNKVYTEFDLISSLFGLEKIKTIGDCYLVAAGIPEANPDHAKAAARFAIEAMKRLKNFDTGNGLYLNFRCGIDCGPVMAGVIGEKKFTYDLWGDVVNTAARMEECCEPGKIQVTERFVNEIRNSDEAVGKVKEADSHGNEFIIEERGFCEIKGKGKMKSYYLIS